MKKSKSRIFLSALIFLAALVLVGVGIWGLISRSRPATFEKLEQMRNYSILSAAHAPLVDQRVQEASRNAYEHASEQKFSRNQRSAYTAEQEALARQQALQEYSARFTESTPAFTEAVSQLDNKLDVYYQALHQEERAFLNAKADATPVPEEPALTPAPVAGEPLLDEALDSSINEDSMRPVVDDLTGFVPSAALQQLKSEATPAADALLAAISAMHPDLKPELVATARQSIEDAVRPKDDSFEAVYDRSLQAGAVGVLAPGEARSMGLVRNADNLLYIGFGLLVLGLAVLFYPQAVKRLGMPRFVILLFFILLIVLAGVYNVAVPGMITNILQRLGMYGVLVLAMLPGIQCGISLNLGMPIGIISGLLGTLIALENNMTGWPAFLFAVVLSIVLALPVGYFYGRLLNRLKGSEMTVSTYVGFSYVSLFCMAWMLLPFFNPKLTWALGSGLRTMHNMNGSIGGLLDNFLRFRILGISVPTGLLAFLLLCCLGMYLFERTRPGVAMLAVGANPSFAKASGINVDKMRVLGTTLSTVIAAVGIIVYSQSFGFMQLYTGPQQMGFIAASAILIGGATVSKAKVYHVLLGTFLFQGVLALGIQVANAMIDVSGLSEVMRILISNGIILYALTQAGGNGRD